MPGIPTFLVVDPQSEKVVLTRSASVNRGQLVALFDEGERALRGAGSGPDAAFEKGQELAGANHFKEAAAAFERALVGTPADWPRRRAAVEALVMARMEAGDLRGCAELAERETRGGVADAWAANLVTMGLGCALEAKLPPAALEKRARQALTVSQLGDDDRSGLYELLVDANHDKNLAAEWLAFLEKQASAAPTPEARAAYESASAGGGHRARRSGPRGGGVAGVRARAAGRLQRTGAPRHRLLGDGAIR